MDSEGVIYFAYCAVNSEKEKDDQKWQAIRNLYPNAIIINPEKVCGLSFIKRTILGCNFLIASDIEGTITFDVYCEISEALKHRIPVFVIRDTNESFSFYEVIDLKQLEGNIISPRYAKVIVKDPNGGGQPEIDPNLLSSPSDIFASTEMN